MIKEPDSRLVRRVHAAANCEPRRGGVRPDMLLLHYTGMVSCERAIDWLARAESRVSCHYVVDVDGTITQMVAEADRAWHAGAGSWGGETDVNSRSIGIEIHNPGHELGYPDFPLPQMQAVAALSRDIVSRNGIAPERVLAHSDIAPDRKIDPGEKFDWAWLAGEGVGHWVMPEPILDAVAERLYAPTSAEVAQVQRDLAAYGYGVDVTGEPDARTASVVAAFQRHFRPARVDGRIDLSTRATLTRLLEALPACRREGR